jgi:DNA-binding CsgD family transcriptional regulator
MFFSVLFDCIALGLYLVAANVLFCRLFPVRNARQRVILLAGVVLWFGLWQAGWASGNIALHEIGVWSFAVIYPCIVAFRARTGRLGQALRVLGVSVTFWALTQIFDQAPTIFSELLVDWTRVFYKNNSAILVTNNSAIFVCLINALDAGVYCLMAFLFERLIKGGVSGLLEKIPLWFFITSAVCCTAIVFAPLVLFFPLTSVFEPTTSQAIAGGVIMLALFLALIVLFVFVIKFFKHRDEHRALLEQLEANGRAVWTPSGGVSNAFVAKYSLTQKETEAVNLLLQGKADKEIAQAMGIAVNTVQAHLQRVYNKTGARGRFALTTLVRG